MKIYVENKINFFSRISRLFVRKTRTFWSENSEMDTHKLFFSEIQNQVILINIQK